MCPYSHAGKPVDPSASRCLIWFFPLLVDVLHVVTSAVRQKTAWARTASQTMHSDCGMLVLSVRPVSG